MSLEIAGRHDRQNELIQKAQEFAEQYPDITTVQAVEMNILSMSEAVEIETGNILIREIEQGDREP